MAVPGRRTSLKEEDHEESNGVLCCFGKKKIGVGLVLAIGFSWNFESGLSGFKIWFWFCSFVRCLVGYHPSIGIQQDLFRMMLLEKARCVDAPC